MTSPETVNFVVRYCTETGTFNVKLKSSFVISLRVVRSSSLFSLLMGKNY